MGGAPFYWHHGIFDPEQQNALGVNYPTPTALRRRRDIPPDSPPAHKWLSPVSNALYQMKHEGGGEGEEGGGGRRAGGKPSPARPRGIGGRNSHGRGKSKDSGGAGSGLIIDDCLPSPCIITFGGTS